MTIKHTIPKEIDEQIILFCKELVPNSNPVFVPIQEHKRKQWCFKNVWEKTQSDGGFMIHGWDITNASTLFLEAEFHSVWKSPSGEYVDVTTPQVKHASKILFLPDLSLNPYSISTIPPNRQFAICL